MKNKNFILKLLACLCVCFSWVMTLSACSENIDNHNLSETWYSNASFHWHKCLDDDCDYEADKQAHVYDDDNDLTCNVCGYERSLIQTYKTVTITGLIKDTKYVKTGETATFLLMLEDKYNPTTLKIKNGNEEIPWTIDPNYSKPSEFSGKSISVGILEIANVQGVFNLTATAEEYAVDFSFIATLDANDMTKVENASQTINNRLAQKQYILEDFMLSDGKTLYYALSNSDYRYEPTASERASNKIELTSRYDSEIYKFNTFLSQSPKTSKSETNKKFYITLDKNDLSSNSITFIVDEITLFTFTISGSSGTLGKISVYYPDNNTTEDAGDWSYYTPLQNAQIRVALVENDNFDLSNVKVYINQTLMSLHTKESDSDLTYYYLDVSKEKSPRYYNNGSIADTYDISITGVTLKAGATNVVAFKLNNQTNKSAEFDGDRFSWQNSSSCYYYDKETLTAYLLDYKIQHPTEPLDCYRFTITGNIQKFSFVCGTTTCTVDLNEVFSDGIIETDIEVGSNRNPQLATQIAGKYPELSNILKINLGQYITASCIDSNGDGKITVDEIIAINFEAKTSISSTLTITILN